MTDNLTSPLWGTGYGSKRHLVGWGPRNAYARCSPDTELEFLGDTAAELVASRLPCARCLKIAEKEAL